MREAVNGNVSLQLFSEMCRDHVSILSPLHLSVFNYHAEQSQDMWSERDEGKAKGGKGVPQNQP